MEKLKRSITIRITDQEFYDLKKILTLQNKILNGTMRTLIKEYIKKFTEEKLKE